MSAQRESPVSKVFDEAIELAIEERSPYPEKSMFLDADSPVLDRLMREAADEGSAVVLVSADGSTEIRMPRNGSPAN